MVSTVSPPQAAVNPLTAGRLPAAAPWGILAGSLLASTAVFALLQVGSGEEDFNIVGAVFFGVVGYVLLVYIVSRLIEGSRRAKDRFVTALVGLAFVVAMLPLISLVFKAAGALTSTSSRCRCATCSARAEEPRTRSSARCS